MNDTGNSTCFQCGPTSFRQDLVIKSALRLIDDPSRLDHFSFAQLIYPERKLIQWKKNSASHTFLLKSMESASAYWSYCWPYCCGIHWTITIEGSVSLICQSESGDSHANLLTTVYRLNQTYESRSKPFNRRLKLIDRSDHYLCIADYYDPSHKRILVYRWLSVFNLRRNRDLRYFDNDSF